MSDQRTAPARTPADAHRALRLLGIAAVVAGVLLLMAAAFVLSYAGIHAVALSAGVSPRLARLYPLIFDAMLVVACAAVLSLRGAGLPSRCYAWLSMLVLLVVAAGADTLHAIGVRLPHKPAAAAAAIIPWALVLIGFGLLMSMLRQARLRLAADEDEGLVEPVGQVEVVAGIDALFGPKPSGSNGFPARNGSPTSNGFPARNGSPTPNGSPARDESLVSPASPAEAASADARAAGPAESDAKSELEAQPEAEPRPQPEADVQPEIEAEAQPEAEPDAGLETEAGPEPVAAAEPEAAEPEPEAAAAQPEESPEPALAGTAPFDRMQGSPAAPGA
jgi:Protein of unknown function (DUF2637)